MASIEHKACAGEDQYSGISKEYKASKLLPFRTCVEAPTLVYCLESCGLLETVSGEGKEKWALQSRRFKAVSGAAGPRIMDLACGDGHYSRVWASMGASMVLGVDISPAMVSLAQEQAGEQGEGQPEGKGKDQGRGAAGQAGQNTTERSNGKTSTSAPFSSRLVYRVGDAMDPDVLRSCGVGVQGTLDVVTGVYVLNYARSREELLAMAKTIAAQLRPGGVFIGMNNDPFTSRYAGLLDAHEAGAWLHKYGYARTRRDLHPEPHLPADCVSCATSTTCSSPSTPGGTNGGNGHGASPAEGKAQVPPLVEGEPILCTFLTSIPGPGKSASAAPPFSFNNYYLPPAVHEEVFRLAGFTHFQWVRCAQVVQADCKGAAADGLEDHFDWTDFCKPDRCPIIGIIARM